MIGSVLLLQNYVSRKATHNSVVYGDLVCVFMIEIVFQNQSESRNDKEFFPIVFEN